MNTQKLRTNRGQTIAFKKYGTGRNTFLLLHGIPGSSNVWHKIAEELSGAGHTVLVPDLLGFGQSSRSADISELWLDAQAKALSECLDQLSVSSFHLVGHDYGGPISVTLCKMISGKVKSLTLLATNTFTDTPIPPPLALIKAPLIGKLWASLIFSKASLRMMLKQGVGSKDIQIDFESSLGDESQTRAIGIIFGSALSELNTRYRSVEDTLSQINVPTLIFWGTKDPFFSLKQGQRTAEAIDGARFVPLEGAGHFLPEERPAEIASELKKLK